MLCWEGTEDSCRWGDSTWVRPPDSLLWNLPFCCRSQPAPQGTSAIAHRQPTVSPPLPRGATARLAGTPASSAWVENPRTQSHASPGLLLPAGCPLGVWGVWWGQGGTPQVAWSGEAASTLGAQGASQTSELGSFPQGLQHFTLRNTVHRAQSRQVLCNGNRAPMPEQPCPPPALEIALSRSETHGGRSCLTRVILSPGHSAPRTPEVNAA